MGLEQHNIERSVIIGNRRATNFTLQSFDNIASSVDVPHGEPILIDPEEKTDDWKDKLYQQVNRNADIDGITACIIVAGDGTVRSVVQAIDDHEPLKKYVFVHVPKGGQNVNKNFYATPESKVNTVLKRGRILNVDLIRADMKGDSDLTRIALVDVGGNDAVPLLRMEEARKRKGKLSLSAKLLHIVRESKVMQPVDMRVSVNGAVVYQRKSFMAELVNGSLQLFGIELAGGTPFDGKLTAAIIPAETQIKGTGNALLLAFNRAFHLQSNPDTAWQIMSSEVQVSFPSEGVTVHADAEYTADRVSEITATIRPGAARFMVPART